MTSNGDKPFAHRVKGDTGDISFNMITMGTRNRA